LEWDKRERVRAAGTWKGLVLNRERSGAERLDAQKRKSPNMTKQMEDNELTHFLFGNSYDEGW